MSFCLKTPIPVSHDQIFHIAFWSINKGQWRPPDISGSWGTVLLLWTNGKKLVHSLKNLWCKENPFRRKTMAVVTSNIRYHNDVWEQEFYFYVTRPGSCAIFKQLMHLDVKIYRESNHAWILWPEYLAFVHYFDESLCQMVKAPTEGLQYVQSIFFP